MVPPLHTFSAALLASMIQQCCHLLRNPTSFRHLKSLHDPIEMVTDQLLERLGMDGHTRRQVLSLCPADAQPTTGSGATPIGSTGRAPDRNSSRRIKLGDPITPASQVQAPGLEFV